MIKYPMPLVKVDVIKLIGGWDQMTPTLSLSPGVARHAQNYEAAIRGGYRRISGYERFDGLPAPHLAIYATAYIDSFVNVPLIGDTILGVTSGHTAVVVGIGADYIAYTKHTGTFHTPEAITVGGLPVGNTVTPTGSITPINNAIYTAAAADSYRADISAPPGSGAALGCVLYKDVVYAFRANTGATAVDLYKSTAAGWVQVPFYNEISFTGGTGGAPTEGDTLTQGGVTATLKRAVLETGDTLWTSTANGRLIIDTVSGGNFISGAATIGGTTVTLSGAESAITMAVGGKFEFDLDNFYGGAETNRVYGCDGVNRCFEFDGNILVPIYTGNPKHIEVHQNHLFISDGALLTNSGTGLPYDFTAASGAVDKGVGDSITGINSLSGNETVGALFVTTRKKNHILYGKDSTDFNLVKLDKGAGALDYTTLSMADTYMMGERGIVSLKASQAYGNFETASISSDINTFISGKVTKVSYAVLDRKRSQYRVFFTDGSGLYVTSVNGKILGLMPVYFLTAVYMATEDTYSDGEEASYFCGTDGFVYQMDKGTSFDGEAIDALLTLNYGTNGSPRTRKRYRKCAIEMVAEGYASINFGYTLGYGKESIGQDDHAAYALAILADLWDEFTWDAFVWDGASNEPLECEMKGTAENVALLLTSSSDYHQPHTINTAMIHYTDRRQMR